MKATAPPQGLLKQPNNTRYDLVEKLGEGTYGVVYKARDKINNQFVAMKKLRLDQDDEGIPPTSIREIALLKELDHVNIVRLMDVLHYKNRIYLVFEFIDFDLKKYLTASKTPLNSLLVKSYMYQIFLAIYYCHSHRVLHRDLKPQNILLDKNGLLKLADFGLARAFGLPMRSYTHQVVTLWYRSPEILLGSKNYGCPVDIWSIGCIYYEMITGKPLFPGDSEIDQLYKIFKILGTPNEQMWPGVSALPEFKTNFPSWNSKDLSSLFVGHANAESDGIDLMNRCLLYDPPKRISAKDAIKHPYFNSLDKTLFGSNGNENSFFS